MLFRSADGVSVTFGCTVAGKDAAAEVARRFNTYAEAFAVLEECFKLVNDSHMFNTAVSKSSRDKMISRIQGVKA